MLHALRALGDPEIAEHSKRFFKTGKGEYGEGDKFLGIRVPVLRRVAKDHVHISDREIITLLESPFHEARLAALFVWVYQFEKEDMVRKREIYTLYLDHRSTVNNWDLVDATTPQILGNYLLQNPHESREFLYEFARSINLWERRIAILTTYAFIRKGHFDETLCIAEMLLHDKHDLIHKAVGWMLREVGKRDRAVLERFLDKNHRGMPRTMLRYAIERFEKGEREYYLRRR